MKFQLKKIVAFIALALTFVSCTNDNDSEIVIPPVVDELAGLTKFKEITNTTHIIELYKHMSGLEQGYNEVSLRIKDKTTNQYVKNASVTWLPIMHMAMMNHSCPKSTVNKITPEGTLYRGYMVFQMAQNATEYWDLKLDYIINETTYTATSVIDVPASLRRRVTTFTGSDNVKYIIAYVDPHHPAVTVNDFVVGVWKMQDMMTFPVIDGYTVKIDPRMPSMGNHSSPNNVNATQNRAGDLYKGKLSLTMTGYWKINLQLTNASGVILKGEAIQGDVTSSSIFLELEF